MTVNTQVTFDLPRASSTQLGGVAVQSSSGILVDSSGDISVDDTQFLEVSTAASTYAPKSAPTFSGTVNSTGPIRVTNSSVGPAALIKIDGQWINFSINGNAGGGIIFPDGTEQFTAYSTESPHYDNDTDVDTTGTDGITRTIPGNLNCYIIQPSSTQTLTMPIVFPTPVWDGQEIELCVYGGPGSYSLSGLCKDGITASSFFYVFTTETNIASKFRYVDLHHAWYQVS